jgi:hypothetical protein
MSQLDVNLLTQNDIETIWAWCIDQNNISSTLFESACQNNHPSKKKHIIIIIQKTVSQKSAHKQVIQWESITVSAYLSLVVSLIL